MAASGKPSTKFPLGELEGQERLPLLIPHIFQIFEIFKNNLFIFQLLQKSGTDRTLKFQSHFHTLILFYKLQYVLHNNYGDSQAFSESNDLQKLLFHGPAHLRAAALLARLATVLVWQRAVSRQPSFRSGNSKGRSPSRYHFSENLKFSKTISLFFNF